MKKILIVLLLLVFAIASGYVFYSFGTKYLERNTVYPTYHPIPVAANTSSGIVPSQPDPSPSSASLPQTKILSTSYHIFQTFNNCGPASLSMALSYFGISKSQEELGRALRPYQIKNGDNDDKSVSLEEMAHKAEEFNLLAYHRPNGTASLIKKFIANDMPVITVTWLKPNEDIGHYRIIKGYDDLQHLFIQDDSYQGKNLVYSYDDFNTIWEKFNYEYLVLVPKDKQSIAEDILGDDLNEQIAWTHAVELSKNQLTKESSNVYARFNLSVAYYNVGDYENSVKEFEAVEKKLPYRTLWYQMDPLLAYYELGKYERVLDISDSILATHNRAYSELYILRGKVFLKQNKKEAAKIEFEKAVYYNNNLQEAKDLLASVS